MLNNLTPAQKAQMQKMNSLGPEQRTYLNTFQNGLNGTIDEEWTKAVLGLLTYRGAAFKIMAKSMFEMSDEQADYWVDMVANMDECTYGAHPSHLYLLSALTWPGLQGTCG